MPWVYLIVAGLCEVAWAVGFKYSQSFTRFWPSVVTMILMLLSFGLLSRAVNTLPLGTSYAVWTGIGAVGTAIYGMMYFGEGRDAMRIVCIGLIVAGIVGLKLLSGAEQ
ncbi:MAG TPA: quaternary ammonium compound efflux SMR transporter SugE [Tepidisphaeraceae bacterium]|nr:quaternary ammonium compound efflux SMR transporter SugE [Tepidisphaeraceae bacterium]